MHLCRTETSQYLAKTVAHGLAGGVVSDLRGGKFGHGFVAAGTSAFSSGAIANAPVNDVGQTMLAATVGGSVSSVTGGKFANGATTAAFSYAFNELSEPSERQRNADKWVEKRYGTILQASQIDLEDNMRRASQKRINLFPAHKENSHNSKKSPSGIANTMTPSGQNPVRMLVKDGSG